MRFKFLLIIGFGLFLFQSCSKKANPFETDEMQVMAMPFISVNAMLDDWHKAAAEADFDGYFDPISEDGFYIGTDASEVWTKEEFIDFAKPYFDKGKAWDFTSRSRNLHFSEDKTYAWFDEILETWMGECRGSGILIFDKKEQSYKIRHYVLSLTVPNDKINDVIGAIGMVEPRSN